jgi:hypothetical protein
MVSFDGSFARLAGARRMLSLRKDVNADKSMGHAIFLHIVACLVGSVVVKISGRCCDMIVCELGSVALQWKKKKLWVI